METLLPYVLDWANLLLRWLHVIVAIAWIGSSFYFVWLDNSLLPPDDPDLIAKGVSGELWAVHGGGFYNPQKYLLAPPKLPDHLHWFYWESYSTWLSGFGLFSVLYLLNANAFLIDRNVFDMTPATAVVLSLAFLVVGWLVYDAICRIFGGREGGDRTVGMLVVLYVALASWLACHLFSGRAAFLIVGAMIATIMSANVFFWIIPGQRKVVASMKAGQKPDPIHGKRGKQRSVHNTYFTLPALFAMMSNHYSMTYAHPHNWAVLVLIMLASVVIRQFFILKHKGVWNWAYPAAGVALLLAVAVWIAPRPDPAATATPDAGPAVPVLADIKPIIDRRCMMCHNAQLASKNIRLDSAEAIRANSQLIHQQAVIARTMPMNNATGITDAERATLGRWFAAGARQ
jgi:uncharacterized membrane protein